MNLREHSIYNTLRRFYHRINYFLKHRKEARKIRGYLKKNGIIGRDLKFIEDKKTNHQNETAVVFLLDSNFVDSFICLLYTLEKTHSFEGLDKVVITIDEKIRTSKLISTLVDKIIYFDFDDFPELPKMKENSMFPQFKRSYINNITYLKLFAFKKLGYSQHVFLDVDMICFNNMDCILNYYRDADLAAVPVIFQSNYLQDNGEELLPHHKMRKVFLNIAENPPQNSLLNSGVMVICHRLLRDEIFDALVMLGQIFSFHSDQNLIFRFTQILRDVKYNALPVWFNVNRPAYDYMGKESFLEDKERILIHHYSGKKPWEKDPGDDDYTWVDDYWYDTYAEAMKYYNIEDNVKN